MSADVEVREVLIQLARSAPDEVADPGLAQRVLARQRRRRHRQWSGIGLSLVTVGVALGARSSGGPVHSAVDPSAAMSHTIEIGETVIVDERIMFRRNDVVEVALLLDGRAFTTVKRVIAANNETVACPVTPDGKCHALTIDGVPQEEPWVHAKMEPFDPVHVGANQIFLMGDNREASADSRAYGPVSISAVKGVVVRIADKDGHRRPVPGAPVHPDPGSDVDPAGQSPPAFVSQP